MSISYLNGDAESIVMNLGGSAVTSHAKKKGYGHGFEVYQVRSKKAEITTLKKEFPQSLKKDITRTVTLSNGVIMVGLAVLLLSL